MQMITSRRQAWAYLSRVSGGANSVLAGAVASLGPVETAERVARGDIAAHPGLRNLEPDAANADLAVIDGLGGRLVTPDEAEWPAAAFAPLATLQDSSMPLALWVLGRSLLPRALSPAAIAITGSRSGTQYGRHVAADLTNDLLNAGLNVTTLSDEGICRAAISSAVATRPTALTILSANGVDVPQSDGIQRLLNAAVTHGGLVVSEAPPGTRSASMKRRVDQVRMLAALTRGVVVVEAGQRDTSDALARAARSLDRFVGAVPGPITSEMSVGTHQLLRTGATVVTGLDDVQASLRAQRQAGAA
ncbi:SMF family protein [Mycolicibacterium rhodesiae JS60]|nr:SMF family protein [Mycolicibacterium rhodesiae JS60]